MSRADGLRAVAWPPKCAHHLCLPCLLDVSDRWVVLFRAPACTQVWCDGCWLVQVLTLRSLRPRDPRQAAASR